MKFEEKLNPYEEVLLEAGYWGFVAEAKKGKKIVKKVVFVNCDPEGNGPGFLEIEDGD